MRSWQRWIPAIGTVHEYRRSWLLPDLVAGTVLAAFVVPVGMAYAPLAGLQPIAGLYASVIALFAYAVFGPTRQLVLGPDSSTAPLVAAVIVPLSLSNASTRPALAAMLGVLVGLMLMLVGLARLGFVTDLLAKPVRIGFMNGVAVMVAVSQLPKLFGFSVTGSTVESRLTAFATSTDQTVPLALAFGLVALVAVLVSSRVAPRFPGMLVVVVASTLLSVGLDAGVQGVDTVGALPQGLPSFALPMVNAAVMTDLLVGALGIAVITLTDSSVLSQSLGHRTPDGAASADSEAVALGAANVAAGLLQGFPVSASMTRSAVNIGSGARSQASGLVAGVLVCVMLVAFPGLLSALPTSVLAAIAIVAGFQLSDVNGTVRLWSQRRTEFVLSIATFLAVILLGVLPGVFVAVTLSLLNFVRRQWRPHDAVLGRVPGVKGYHDTSDFSDAQQVPGLMIFRFDAPLFFANARVFRERLETRIAAHPGRLRRVVFAAQPLIDVDTTAADALSDAIRALKHEGIEVGFAELKHPVHQRLDRYGIIELVGEQMLFPTVGSAVHDYVRASGVEWVDWEDAADSNQTPAAGG